eukprot:Seg940.10 transcript_id=Seg940.10/GoldUCD/mRNA.D3Y31 product="Protein FAM214A" protein_id=Seg940.10/GoldUCD/D3Y31
MKPNEDYDLNHYSIADLDYEISPVELVQDIGVLIVEGRLPEFSKNGRREGNHCWPVCPDSKKECCKENGPKESSMCNFVHTARKRVQSIWRETIPVFIEVLVCLDNLFPHHGHDKEPCEIFLDFLPPTQMQRTLLLERWKLEVHQKNSSTSISLVNINMLLQAVRSFLHFSQLSAWFIRTGGRIPSRLFYRIVQGEPDNQLDFTSLPEIHEFPQALTSRIQSISTTVFSLPRFDLETLISMSPYREYNLRIEHQISMRSRDKSIAECEHSDSEETPDKACETKMKRRSMIESRQLSVIFIPEPNSHVKSKAKRGKSNKISSSLKKRLSFENEGADSRNIASFQIEENCRHKKQDGAQGSTARRKQTREQCQSSNDGVTALGRHNQVKEQPQSSNNGVRPLVQHHQSKEQFQSCSDGIRPLAGGHSKEIVVDRKEEYKLLQGKDGAFCGRHIGTNKGLSHNDKGQSEVCGLDRNSVDVERNGNEQNGSEQNGSEQNGSEKNGNDDIAAIDHTADHENLHHKTFEDDKFLNGATHTNSFHIGDEELSNSKNGLFQEFKDGVDENSNGLCEKENTFNGKENQFNGFTRNGFMNRTKSEGSPLLCENIPDQIHRSSENVKNGAQNQNGNEGFNRGSFENNDVFADTSSCSNNGNNHRLVEKNKTMHSGLSLSEQIASSSENSFDSDTSEGGSKGKVGSLKREKEKMIYERSQSSRCLSEIEVHEKSQERLRRCESYSGARPRPITMAARLSLGACTVPVFHSKTGLPVASSPAPLRRPEVMKSSDQIADENGQLLSPSVEIHKTRKSSSESYSPHAKLLSRSAPASTRLLGNFEESVLKGRIPVFGTVEGFTAQIGASGSFCPQHITLPIKAQFFRTSDDNAPSPYMGYITLRNPKGKKGYHVPRRGTIQLTIFNPNKTVVKVFVVLYDFNDMPCNTHTFLRQKIVSVKTDIDDQEEEQQNLHYLVHLRFASTKHNHIYLHTDIRVIFPQQSPDISSSKLKVLTYGPVEPKYTERDR